MTSLEQRVALANELLDEVQRQRRLGWTPEHDDAEGLPHLLLLIRDKAWRAEHLEGAGQRHKLVIIGALALAALESFDRSEVPPQT